MFKKKIKEKNKSKRTQLNAVCQRVEQQHPWVLRHAGIPSTAPAARPPPWSPHSPARSTVPFSPVPPESVKGAMRRAEREAAVVVVPSLPAPLSPASPPTADTRLTSPASPGSDASPTHPQPPIKGKLSPGGKRRGFLTRGCTPLEHPETRCGAEVGASLAKGLQKVTPAKPRPCRHGLTPDSQQVGPEASRRVPGRPAPTLIKKNQPKTNYGRASNMTSGKKKTKTCLTASYRLRVMTPRPLYHFLWVFPLRTRSAFPRAAGEEVTSPRVSGGEEGCIWRGGGDRTKCGCPTTSRSLLPCQRDAPAPHGSGWTLP